jgi:hypothetical protein
MFEAKFNKTVLWEAMKLDLLHEEQIILDYFDILFF